MKINTKICCLCSKPHKQKTQLCMTCNRENIKVYKELFGKKGKLSIVKLLWIKKNHPGIDVFEYVRRKENLTYFNNNDKVDMNCNKMEVMERHKSNEYKKMVIDKENSFIPDYISMYFKTRETLTIQSVGGNANNPTVYYYCNVCKREFHQKFSDIKKGHDCVSNKSSGEVEVEMFLKNNNILFKTQRDTLKCLNPKTGYVMPYDIELINCKLIIEIQGDQHYKYVPIFHVSIENFKYQQEKDRIKKDFALKKGYKYLEINYKDISSGIYKEKIKNIISA